MKKISKKYLFLVLILISQFSFSQFYNYNNDYYENDVILEVGGGIGIMNSLTDIGGKKGIGKKFIKDLNLNYTKFSSSYYVGAMFREVFGLRLEATFGKVEAWDSILYKYKSDKDARFRYNRNLNFRSSISEFALIGEFHPLMLKDYIDFPPPRFSPYLMAGIGMFNFNPQAYYQGNWISVQPLSLEGQNFKEYPDRKQYKLSAMSYPIGLGVKYEISNLLVARLELNHRFTSTDHLDDVSADSYIDPALFDKYLSPYNASLAKALYDRHAEINPAYVPTPNYTGMKRGNSKDNDAFFTVNLKIGITLGREVRK